MTERRASSKKLLWLLLLVPFSGGIAYGLGKSELTDASVAGTDQEIQMGALSLALGVGLAIFAIVLALQALVNGRGAAAKVVALIACVVLVVAGVLMCTMLYPSFLDMVSQA
ncbi:hypothetical protein [Cumulibacter soli]|uniref:hypothetical protein n=1 Tax=Cumulibacter soli TaxID=2546344 RepID=UPI001068AEF4|nr:hypothetical protein [Cumulibacter soli]